jgi:hypothetical protein
MNKKLFLLSIMAIVLILGGCSNSNRIDTSSLVQTITAENKSGKTVYNFYLLENSEDVQGVSVEADSLEKAVISAKKAYIPALTLSKLELYLIDSNLGEKTLKTDIDYISKETAISPLTYTALSDTKTLQLFSKVKEHIVLLKNNNNNLSVTSLSIFNNFKGKNNGYLSICYISSDKELKADIVKTVTEK